MGLRSFCSKEALEVQGAGVEKGDEKLNWIKPGSLLPCWTSRFPTDFGGSSFNDTVSGSRSRHSAVKGSAGQVKA
jgi:hypothetical protein